MLKRMLTTLLVLTSIVETTLAIKITYGPYLQMITENEAVIVWTTDKKALSWVEIAPDDSFNFYAEQRPQYFETYLGRKVLNTVHKIKINKLEKGTTYRYRIYSQEVLDEQDYQITYGPVTASNVYSKAPLTFRTLNSDKETINFMMVNDIHGDNVKLNNLLKDFKKGETDFVLFNGDMVSHMDNESQLFEGFINTSVKLFASETPFYMVRGNHESRGVYAKQYLNYFPTPTGMPYYTFKEGPVFFIVMDGGEDKPDNDIEYLGTAAFDQYREEEAEWLRKVVESDDFKSSPFKVAVIHVPPVQDTWHGPLHTKKMFLPILNNAKIDLMLCGHLHRHIYNPPHTDGADFPVLINSNSHVLKVNANTQKMNIHIEDEKGKTIKTFSYDTQKQ